MISMYCRNATDLTDQRPASTLHPGYFSLNACVNQLTASLKLPVNCGAELTSVTAARWSSIWPTAMPCQSSSSSVAQRPPITHNAEVSFGASTPCQRSSISSAALSVSQPTSQSVSQPTCQSVSRPLLYSTGTPASQRGSQAVSQSANESFRISFSKSASQPASQSASQAASQPTSQSVSQSVRKTTSQPASQTARISVSQSVRKCCTQRLLGQGI